LGALLLHPGEAVAFQEIGVMETQDLKNSCLLFLAIGLFACVHLLQAQTPAFPGAEGAGRYTQGGRGGAVYEVTHLEDSGPGSLRAAVEAGGPRTVVFRVSGTIKLLSDLNIRNDSITVAGQTAPGGGICIRDRQVVIRADHVILRYLRFRLGDETGVDTDAIWGRENKHFIIDHCSASWSVDEAMSFYGNDSTTVQWCILSESLYLSNHPKGAHGYGGIWGGRDASFHHNLIAHHSSRTPRFSGGETAACENVDFRNNVIYNWGFNSAYGGESGRINMVANYFKPGPASKSGVRSRIVQISDANGKWYIEDNVMEGSPGVTENNWKGGVQGNYAAEAVSRAYTPFPCVPISEESAEEAYGRVLENAGANFPSRDTVDARVILEVRNGTAAFEGKGYENIQGFSDTSIVRGIIDSQTDVGGWPELIGLPAPADSDHDGMPDEWEQAQGLNPADDADRNLLDEEGYTMLEKYLNGLVSSSDSHVEPDIPLLSDFHIHPGYPNPFNQAATLAFSLRASGFFEAAVFDVAGRLRRNLLWDLMPAGFHSIRWDGRDDGGNAVPSGVYLCVFRFNGNRKTAKIQLIQ
jgi:hypothetical protein